MSEKNPKIEIGYTPSTSNTYTVAGHPILGTWYEDERGMLRPLRESKGPNTKKVSDIEPFNE